MYCTECHGRGLDNHDEPCAHCNGEGTEPDRFSVEDEVLKLVSDLDLEEEYLLSLS